MSERSTWAAEERPWSGANRARAADRRWRLSAISPQRLCSSALRTVWRGWRLSNSMRLEFLHKRLASPTLPEDPNSDRGERPSRMRVPLKTRLFEEVPGFVRARPVKNTYNRAIKLCSGPPGPAAPCGCGVLTRIPPHNLVLGVRRVCASLFAMFHSSSRAVPGSTCCRVYQYLCLEGEVGPRRTLSC